MIYTLIAAFLLLWGLFIFKVVTDKRLEGFFYKGFSSFLFVSIAVYGAYHFLIQPNVASFNMVMLTKYFTLILFIILGLVAGLIGDLFLEVQYFYDKKKYYTIHQGMIIFLIGHVLYIIGLISFVKFNIAALVIGLVMTIVVYVGGKIMKLQMGKLAPMTYLYTFVIFTMVGFAIIQASELSFNLYSIYFMVGAILFGLSDLLLAPIYFKDEKSKFFVVSNLATYYLGQLLIALSIFFL
ncbi:MAG: lysoplasmalogenase [Acholeplasmataceae bacterium]|nr:lysoplasmalogenase [Acholeplasmataceae bacterium]